jgi:hypothetical protein
MFPVTAITVHSISTLNTCLRNLNRFCTRCPIASVTRWLSAQPSYHLQGAHPRDLRMIRVVSKHGASAMVTQSLAAQLNKTETGDKSEGLRQWRGTKVTYIHGFLLRNAELSSVPQHSAS